MKHKPKVIAILIVMFLLTQFIGLYVVNYYSGIKIVDGEEMNVTSPDLPLGLETPEVEEESDFLTNLFPSFILAFVMAISILFLLQKFKAKFILKGWFFLVVIIAFMISLPSFMPQFKNIFWISLIIALSLAYFKIYQGNLIVHNLTELLIYPGIAAVFVPILNIYTAILLLILISVYDMWAVWHSGIMQKMAKYQMDNLKIMGGFVIPYLSDKMRKKVKKMKKAKDPKDKGKKIRVNLAILGGGDVIFPIILSGVALKTLGYLTVGPFTLPLASFLVIFGATAGLTGLFLFSEKKKFYPAMPFITIGVLVGLGLSYLVYAL